MTCLSSNSKKTIKLVKLKTPIRLKCRLSKGKFITQKQLLKQKSENIETNSKKESSNSMTMPTN